MLEKEKQKWDNIKTVKDFVDFIESKDLDVLGWQLHNRDLSKSGFWIGAHVKFDIDLENFLNEKPDIAPDEISTANRTHQEIEEHKKYGSANGYARHSINKNLAKIVEALGFEEGYSSYVNNQRPHNLLRRHSDLISCYINEQQNILNQEFDKEKKQPKEAKPIWRCFVALDDWHEGQIVNFEPDYWSHWKKGDVMFFDWQNTAHSTANTGVKDRPLLKITGTMKDDSFVHQSRETGKYKTFNV